MLLARRSAIDSPFYYQCRSDPVSFHSALKTFILREDPSNIEVVWKIRVEGHYNETLFRYHYSDLFIIINVLHTDLLLRTEIIIIELMCSTVLFVLFIDFFMFPVGNLPLQSLLLFLYWLLRCKVIITSLLYF